MLRSRLPPEVRDGTASLGPDFVTEHTTHKFYRRYFSGCLRLRTARFTLALKIIPAMSLNMLSDIPLNINLFN